MDLYLREATYADRDLLFKWANDSTVRQNAFNTEPITYENHVKWFDRIMSDDKVMQYILCKGNEPVGQIRLNIEDKRAYIDYSIAPDKRGLGLGETMLKSMIKLLKDIKERNFTALTGQVKYENAASARVFEKCGFIRSDKSDYIEYVKALED